MLKKQNKRNIVQCKCTLETSKTNYFHLLLFLSLSSELCVSDRLESGGAGVLWVIRRVEVQMLSCGGPLPGH